MGIHHRIPPLCSLFVYVDVSEGVLLGNTIYCDVEIMLLFCVCVCVCVCVLISEWDVLLLNESRGG